MIRGPPNDAGSVDDDDAEATSDNDDTDDDGSFSSMDANNEPLASLANEMSLLCLFVRSPEMLVDVVASRGSLEVVCSPTNVVAALELNDDGVRRD